MSFEMEQSFWFENVCFDKNDFPIDKPEYIDSINNKSSIFDDYNLFDNVYGVNRYIMVSELLETNNVSKWKEIREKIRECDSITIINNLYIDNEELLFISDFYMKTFYAALKKENPKCYAYY